MRPPNIFSTHGNQLSSLSGVHSLKDFLSSDHLVESFDGRSYTYGSVLKSNFYHKTTQQDGHYRANPSNHELLTVRGVDCRVSKKMFGGLIPPYCRFTFPRDFYLNSDVIGVYVKHVTRASLDWLTDTSFNSFKLIFRCHSDHTYVVDKFTLVAQKIST